MRENSLYVLHPYRFGGSWVFDDDSVGLKQEPFVFGIDEMIDRLVADLPDAAKGFRLLFSTSAFPGFTAKLEWQREEAGGNWYHSPTFGFEGWLCPALFKYFEKAPEMFFIKAEPLKSA